MTEKKIKIQLKKDVDTKEPINCDNLTNRIVVDFHGKTYLVMIIKTGVGGEKKDMPVIIDYEDYERIKNIRWCRTGHYISHKIMVSGEIYVTYLHQAIMNHLFDGKVYIDHINRIPQDNRKENLRTASQTEQNWNQRKRKRTLKLPDDCGFDPDEIPTNIEFHPEKGYNAYFEVVIKVDGKRICRKKSSKSQKFTLLQKLTEAKIILRNLMVEKPEWFEKRCMNGLLTEEGNQLYESYFAILKLAHVEDPFNQYLDHENRNKDPLNIGDEHNASSKHVNKMPSKETNIDKLPKYCRYAPPSETRGDYFEYDKKTDGERIIHRTSTSKDISTNDKFVELILLLENNKIIEWESTHIIP